MTRRVALPLLASGLALLALAATVLPFQADALQIAGQAPWDRLLAFRAVAIATTVLLVSAVIACWRAPRHPGALILLALALGTLGGAATLVAMPDLLATPPIQVAAQAH